MKHSFSLLRCVPVSMLLCGAVLVGGSPARAADDDGYRIGENGKSAQAARPNDTGRVARISFTSGDVTWRPDLSAKWSKAGNGTPIGKGSQIWVNGGGRAEVRFDDGSALRLGRDAIATVQTFYRDDEGPFTRIKLNTGLSTLRIKQSRSVYEVVTPLLTVQTNGPARVRIGAGDTAEVGVRMGTATVKTGAKKTVVESGGYLTLADAGAPVTLRNLPPPDSWERWNDDRDRALYGDDAMVVVHPHPYYAPAPSVWFYVDIPFGGRGYGHYHGHGYRR